MFIRFTCFLFLPKTVFPYFSFLSAPSQLSHLFHRFSFAHSKALLCAHPFPATFRFFPLIPHSRLRPLSLLRSLFHIPRPVFSYSFLPHLPLISSSFSAFHFSLSSLLASFVTSPVYPFLLHHGNIPIGPSIYSLAVRRARLFRFSSLLRLHADEHRPFITQERDPAYATPR